MITVTPAAAKKIVANLTKRGHGVGIRLGVRTTGCSGLAYVLEYVDTLAPEDTAFEQDGFVVVVDPKSLSLMDGLEVDYVKPNPKLLETVTVRYIVALFVDLHVTRPLPLYQGGLVLLV